MASTIASDIFSDLDRIGHRLIHSILSEEELARIPDKTNTCTVYDVFKDKAIAFFNQKDRIDHLRDKSIEIAAGMGMKSPVATAACSLIFNQIGECGELSIFTMVKASLVFKGTTCLVTIANPTLEESHGFNVLFNKESEAVGFKDLLLGKGKFKVEDLLGFPTASIIDAYFRKSFLAKDVMEQSEFCGYFKSHKIAEVVSINLKKKDSQGEIVLAQATALAKMISTIPVPKSPLVVALERHREEDRIKEENKAMIKSRFSGLTWSDSGRLLLAKGDDAALREMEAALKSTFSVFQGVFDRGERFALVCVSF